MRRFRIPFLIALPLLLGALLVWQKSRLPYTLSAPETPTAFWLLPNGKLVPSTPPPRYQAAITALAFSGDGHVLTAGRTAPVFRLMAYPLTGKMVPTYDGGAQLQQWNTKSYLLERITLPYPKPQRKDPQFSGGYGPPLNHLISSFDGKRLFGDYSGSTTVLLSNTGRVLGFEEQEWPGATMVAGVMKHDVACYVHWNPSKPLSEKFVVEAHDVSDLAAIAVQGEIVFIRAHDGTLLRRVPVNIRGRWPQHCVLLPHNILACAANLSESSGNDGGYFDSNQINLYSTRTGHLLKTWWFTSPQLSPHRYSKPLGSQPDTTFRLSNTSEYEDGIGAIAASPNGYWLATATHGGSINLNLARLYNVSTGQSYLLGNGTGEPIGVLAFSPDSKQLATGSYQGLIQLWDVSSHALNHTIGRHGSSTPSIAWSPDGHTLATASGTTIKLWHIG